MGKTIANGKDILIHNLDLNDYGFKDISKNKTKEVKKEISDYLKNEIIREVHKGSSPIKGEGKFKLLSKAYSKREKGGIKRSNLQLEGDLLDSLIVSPSTGSKIKVGHEGKQVPKADGHNQLSTKAKNWASKKDFPKRNYIPNSNQVFNDKIVKEITSIIKAATPDKTIEQLNNKPVEQAAPVIDSKINTTENIALTLDNFLNEVSISDLLTQEILRRFNGL